jgi:hypothetical protein
VELVEEEVKEEEACPAQLPETSLEKELKNEKADEEADAEHCIVTRFQVCAQGFELCFSPTLVLNSVPEVSDELEREDRAGGHNNDTEKQIDAEQG